MTKTNEEKLYENGKTPTQEDLETARKIDKKMLGEMIKSIDKLNKEADEHIAKGKELNKQSRKFIQEAKKLVGLD